MTSETLNTVLTPTHCSRSVRSLLVRVLRSAGLAATVFLVIAGLRKNPNNTPPKEKGPSQMTERQRGLWTGLFFATLAIGLLIVTMGCKRQRSDVYAFEPEPRSVIAQAGITPSRYARVAADWISSSTVYMLAVLGDSGKSRLAMLISSDGGDTFGAPVRVSEEGQTVTSAGEDSPAFIATPNAIYAAWNEGGELRFARSVSWGESFEKPIKITDKTGKFFSGYPSLGVAPNQDVYAVWIDTRDQVGDSDDNYSLYVARSTNHGQSFGKNVRVAARICPCCRPTLTFGPKGELVVFWRHVYEGPVRDMTFAVSTDNGQTFSAPERVAEDNWKINGCPDSGPAVARSGKRVYVAWLTEASPQMSGVRLTWSDDSGKTWAPAVMGSQNVLDANYPALSVADDGTAVLVFQGRDPKTQGGWGKTAVYAVEISPRGDLSAPEVVPGITAPASRPTVAAGTGGRIYIAWTQNDAAKPTVFLSRARRQVQ